MKVCILTYSVGRCVIPCASFGKSVKHTFSSRKMYSVKEKKMFTIFLWRFKVTVTSQSDVPIFSLKVECYELPAGINMNCVISCVNFTGDMLISEHKL